MKRSRTYARCAAWAAFASPTLLAGRALAEDDAPRVALVVDPCPEAGAWGKDRETAKLLALELRASLVDVQPGVTTVRVSCSMPLATLEVDDPITRKTVTRKIEIAGFPETARARVIALAAAELVSASWSEAATNPTPKVEPAGPPPAEAERTLVALRAAGDRARAKVAAKPPPARHAITGSALARVVVGEVSEVGGALRYTGDVTGQRAGVGLTLDLSAAQGRARVDLGAVSASTVDVAGGLYAYARLGEDWLVRGGAGMRVGSASLDGRPTDQRTTSGSSVAGVYTAPHLAIALRAQTTSALLFELAIEAGTVALGPTGRVVGATRATEVAFQGLYVAPTLGAGARF